MYSDGFWWLLPLAAFVWLGVLSYIASKQGSFLKSLFPSSGERDIRKKFDEILELDSKLKFLSEESLKSISKVALVRYNPYQDTGGDQSFSLGLLNAHGNGFVITSLHTRSGTRVYAKPVVGGKAQNYKFSDEEEEVIRKAMKNEF